MAWTMARVKGFEGLPDTYQTYVIKKDGMAVGELRYDRSRWKSAGGPAWKGTRPTSLGMTQCFNGRSKVAVLNWFKEDTP